MTERAAPCGGTRQTVVDRRRPDRPSGGTWTQRYGVGACAVCGKVVTCHKDGSAVFHFPERGA